MFHLNATLLLDDLISMGLELHHRRKIGGDGVGGEHFRVDDTVKRPAELFDSAQAGQ